MSIHHVQSMSNAPQTTAPNKLLVVVEELGGSDVSRRWALVDWRFTAWYEGENQVKPVGWVIELAGGDVLFTRQLDSEVHF
ncbi:hypothetical protein [Ralstonia phage RP13]|nr:hypothetical protein [Ralstonia phage RP13]